VPLSRRKQHLFITCSTAKGYVPKQAVSRHQDWGMTTEKLPWAWFFFMICLLPLLIIAIVREYLTSPSPSKGGKPYRRFSTSATPLLGRGWGRSIFFLRSQAKPHSHVVFLLAYCGRGANVSALSQLEFA
jgi:hypothetical protein